MQSKLCKFILGKFPLPVSTIDLSNRITLYASDLGTDVNSKEKRFILNLLCISHRARHLGTYKDMPELTLVLKQGSTQGRQIMKHKVEKGKT